MRRVVDIILIAGIFTVGCQSGPVSGMRSSRAKHLPKQIIEMSGVRPEVAVTHLLAYLAAENYCVESCSEELGFINATRSVPVYAHDDDVKTSLLEVTIHVKEAADGCSVKVHFVGKDFDAGGIVTALRPVQDDAFYDTFLRRIRAHIKGPKPLPDPSRSSTNEEL